MELMIIIITVLPIFFSSFLPHTASLQLPLMQQQPSLQNQVNARQLSLPPLPRKLRSTEHKEYEVKDLALHKKEKKKPSGEKEERKPKMAVGKKGTRQEWVEGDDDPSQYFTMDYSSVRRRSPIHNKHIPVAP